MCVCMCGGMHVLLVVYVGVKRQLGGISSLTTFIWVRDETQVIDLLLSNNHFSPSIH